MEELIQDIPKRIKREDSVRDSIQIHPLSVKTIWIPKHRLKIIFIIDGKEYIL